MLEQIEGSKAVAEAVGVSAAGARTCAATASRGLRFKAEAVGLQRLGPRPADRDDARRTSSFDEVQGGLTDNALFEARAAFVRQLFAATTASAWAPTTPSSSSALGKRYAFNYEYCKGCGICAAELRCDRDGARGGLKHANATRHGSPHDVAAGFERPAFGRLRHVVERLRPRPASRRSAAARSTMRSAGRGVELAREARPAVQHERIAPGVLERPGAGRVVEVAAGLEHARQHRVRKALEVAPQRLARQQRLDAGDAQTPAVAPELARDERLQRLHRIEQAQPVGRQHEQRQPGRLRVRQLGDEGTQHRDARPGRGVQAARARRRRAPALSARRIVSSAASKSQSPLAWLARVLITARLPAP